jgi:hypothetical protein
MVNWQITATTIFCDAVADEVTVMVHKDGAVTCTGYQKYHEPSRGVKKALGIRGKELKKKLSCHELPCPLVTAYRDKLFAEEAAGKEKGQP